MVYFKFNQQSKTFSNKSVHIKQSQVSYIIYMNLMEVDDHGR